MKWNGVAWNEVPSPNTSGTESNYLAGIACGSYFDCWAVGQYWQKGSPQTLTLHSTLSPSVTSVVSRKTHGLAGSFDIDLPPGGFGVECRSGGPSGDYTIVFTFANNLTSVGGVSVTSVSNASIISSGIDSSDRHQYVVNLTGVTNRQVVFINLSNVVDSAVTFSNTISASMIVLVGDTTADDSVNSADISQTKSQSGQPVTNSNFREDVTADGSINSADISLVKSKSGTALP